MNKIGICTLYTGYNVGSALQAYATKEYLDKKGYNSVVLKIKGSLVRGRDIRIKKLLITIIRMLIHSNRKIKVIKSFFENKKNSFDNDTINKFDLFYKNNIKPLELSYRELSKKAKNENWKVFICGSDQIWNSTAFYVDPFYYLQFSPKEKRIAYAPSFGRNFVPKYNEKIIKKYINNINYISVREESGSKIIKKLIKKDSVLALDPTLLINKNEWIKMLNIKKRKLNDYIFCYFLNQPDKKVTNFIYEVSKKNGYDVIFFNKGYNNKISGGPIEFLNLLYNSKMVFTDSFHGTAFSINFNKEFYVFKRKYITDDQSTRIVSLLKSFDLKDRFENYSTNNTIDFSKVDLLLNNMRKESKRFLDNSIKQVIRNE